VTAHSFFIFKNNSSKKNANEYVFVGYYLILSEIFSSFAEQAVQKLIGQKKQLNGQCSSE
jgi:hypothetical protein